MSKAAEHDKYYQNLFHWTDTAQDGNVPAPYKRANDPYEYSAGWGNAHASEAIPGTLPQGQNSPRQCRFGLYAEQLTVSAFIAPRQFQRQTWLYRMRPAVAHKGYTDLPDNPDCDNCFLPSNPRIHVSPTQLAWKPFDIPEGSNVDFVAGLKAVAGCGDPSLREGLVTLMYMANADMKDTAYVNQDGEMMLLPQQGRLDIQTEFGWLYVQPGEICVIPRGVRFSVNLPDGPSRGYALELWGSMFEIPELGPLGGYGLANARDFLYPKAYYDDPEREVTYRIVSKLNGRYFLSTQPHTVYDVVAWHGTSAPYKYDLTKFVNIGSISVDHIDPSVFCVLTARSRDPTAPLVDFLIFSPRWDVASNTYRPPFYHRNGSSELMGLLYGEYGGRSDEFQPGSLSFETGMTPHGVAYPEFKAASENVPPEMKISLGSIAFMFESSRAFAITEYAWASDKIHYHDPKMWDDLVSNFPKHLDEVKKIVGEKWRHGVNDAGNH